MKKYGKLILIVLLISLCAMAFAACDNGTNGVKKYTVTVEGGSGGGKYEEGTEVTIVATAPEGKVFVNWKVNNVVVDTENPYKFTVTKDITFIATFYEPTSGLEFKLLDDGTYEISDAGEAETQEYIVLPDKHQGKPVSRIGRFAFNGTRIVSITIPMSVTSIGDNAFYFCEFLTGINIPSSVTIIEEYAFDACMSMTVINFAGESKLTEIGEGAFNSCEWLTAINIPKGVTKIGNNAFWSCLSLTAINVHEDNPNYKSIDGVLYNKAATESICYPSGREDTSFELPLSVTKIGSVSFMATSLVNIVFHKDLTEIGAYAFYGNALLESVTIPKNVTKIGSEAFGACDKLTIYTEFESRPENWLEYSALDENDNLVNYGWNSGIRPILWGCVLAGDQPYVVSFTKTENSFDYIGGSTLLSAPFRSGHYFTYWNMQESGLGTGVPITNYFQFNQIELNVTVYTVWSASA